MAVVVPEMNPRFREAIDRWVNRGIRPGGFLLAVLENDLLGAFLHGNGESIANLPQVVAYLYNDCSAPCWGSKEVVGGWRGLAWPDAPDDPEERIEERDRVDEGAKHVEPEAR